MPAGTKTRDERSAISTRPKPSSRADVERCHWLGCDSKEWGNDADKNTGFVRYRRDGHLLGLVVVGPGRLLTKSSPQVVQRAFDPLTVLRALAGRAGHLFARKTSLFCDAKSVDLDLKEMIHADSVNSVGFPQRALRLRSHDIAIHHEIDLIGAGSNLKHVG